MALDDNPSRHPIHGAIRCNVYCYRGIGRSYIPQVLSEYSTTAMCGDTLGLLDTLGWERAHVVGMSMGGEWFAFIISTPACTTCLVGYILNSKPKSPQISKALDVIYDSFSKK